MKRIDRCMTIWLIAMLVMVFVILPATVIVTASISHNQRVADSTERKWGIIDRNFKCKTCSTDRAIFRTVSESTNKCELDTSVSAAVYGWK